MVRMEPLATVSETLLVESPQEAMAIHKPSVKPRLQGLVVVMFTYPSPIYYGFLVGREINTSPIEAWLPRR
jgi:hypothetical protein